MSRDPLSQENDDNKAEETVAIRIVIEGKVQSVGFRQWLRKCALDREVSGWVRNKNDGRVEALLTGVESHVKDAVSLCFQGPPAASVRRVKEFPETEVRTHHKGFIMLPTL